MLIREVVLGLLIEQPMHAYALKKVLTPRLSPSDAINDGILYPMLAKLAEDELIHGAEETGKNNRVRTIYRATARGKARFNDWLACADDESDESTYDFFMGHPFLVKVQFFKRLPDQLRKAKLLAQIERTQGKLKQFDIILAGMRERNADPFRISLLQLGMAQQKQTLRWLRSLSQGVDAPAGRNHGS